MFPASVESVATPTPVNEAYAGLFPVGLPLSCCDGMKTVFVWDDLNTDLVKHMY